MNQIEKIKAQEGSEIECLINLLVRIFSRNKKISCGLNAFSSLEFSRNQKEKPYIFVE